MTIILYNTIITVAVGIKQDHESKVQSQFWEPRDEKAQELQGRSIVTLINGT